MKKNQINRTIHKMTFDITLLDILKTKDNHKLSRFDAFMWLAEHILDGFPCSQREGQLQLYKVTNSELAKLWHWSRPSVQKFTQELIDLGLLRRERFGKYFAYSLSAEAEKLIK